MPTPGWHEGMTKGRGKTNGEGGVRRTNGTPIGAHCLAASLGRALLSSARPRLAAKQCRGDSMSRHLAAGGDGFELAAAGLDEAAEELNVQPGGGRRRRLPLHAEGEPVLVLGLDAL